MKLSLIKLLLFVLILLPLEMWAQESPMLLRSECNSWRGTEITAGTESLCFSATGVVQEIHVDSSHAILYALIRESKRGNLKRDGHVVAYDLGQSRELWTIPFDFIRDQFFLVDSLPVITGRDETFCVNRQSGVELWRVNFEIGLVTKRGVGLGKDFNVLLGLDLRNGKELWRKSGKFDEIESFEIHGDTAAVFLRKGLNFLDLQTGAGFVVEAKTLEGANAASGAGIGAAAAFGALGGLVGGLLLGVAVIVVSADAGPANQRADNSLTSIYIYEEHVFFTSKTELYKVNLNGDVVWKEPVEKAIGSARKVFVVNDAVYLISKGVLSTPNGPIYSDAVLHKMNVDGRGSILGVQLNTGNREYVEDFLIKDSTIVIALKNKLVEIRLDDLSTMQEESFGRSNQHAGFGAILNPPAILFSDSTFVMAAEKYPGDFFVANTGGMKIRFSEGLAPVEAIREKNYFAIRQKVNGNDMFITNGTDVYLVDSKGERLSDFSFTTGMKYVGGKVHDFEDNRIFVVEGF
ncbi:PQQ-binding-like beta-propeller repeat protein [Cryomorpha ignava]|uniref:PQQ-binding-like beta-propeller repeat protein n=1 Tax=Cryomorpha ignava TaxID=101383 RepID=A0A7K3WS40_9FLAO|nr:PQQ-binding-like beta-propeller repeat protein [Cryomorpha ignava]NEN24487.1 PQQ-binding-like beta-propeller repeat protein [Cryomorpha ignava]